MRLKSFLVMALFSITNTACATEKGDDNKSLNHHQEAIFAMGCFWCGAAAFADHVTNEKFPGIISVKAGYTGGKSVNPTYENHEGHIESVKVVYDPQKISYDDLLDIFWHNVDPFDAVGQFCDKGPSYVSAIFYTDQSQKLKAETSKQAMEKKLGKPIVTKVIQATPFYDAEDYHQDYKIKNPIRYKYYRWNCGRDARLEQVWGAHPSEYLNAKSTK